MIARERTVASRRPRGPEKQRPPAGGVGFLAGVAFALCACSNLPSDQRSLERELANAGAPRNAPARIPVRATGTGRLESVWPATPLRGAGGLACDDGHLLVTEPLAGRLSTVTADGRVSRVTLPKGSGEPTDVAVNRDGVVFVAAMNPGALWRREPSGGWRNIGAAVSDPVGVAVGKGRLFVAECAGETRVLHLDPDTGAIVEVLATHLGCPGRLSLEPEGTLLVPLPERGEVVVINPATRETSVGARGLDLPSATGRSPDGIRLVLEAGSGRVRSLATRPVETAQGQTDRATSSAKANLRTLLSLEPGLADVVVCGETLVISNAVDGSLSAWKPWPGARRILVPGGLVAPGGLAFDGSDPIIADGVSVKRIRNGKLQLIAMTRFDGMPPPVGLAGSDTGLAWITSPQRGELFQLDLGRGAATRIVAGLDWPTSVLRTPGGELIVAETGAGRVVRIGLGLLPYTLAGSLMSPVGLTARGERILTSEPRGGRVLSLRREGVPTVIASDLAAPAGLATTRGRPLYIAVERAGTIIARSSDGSEHRVAEGLSLRTRRAPHPLPIPIAIAPDGSVYVASPEEGSVVRIIPD